MKTKTYFILLFIGLSFATACSKKDSGSGGAPSGIPKIKTITHQSGTYQYSMHYLYDVTGRLIKLIYSDSSYLTLAYNANTVTAEDYSKTNHLEGRTVYTLNSAGLALFAFHINTYKSGQKGLRHPLCGISGIITQERLKTAGSDTSTIAFLYDNNGYLIMATETNLYGTYSYTYEIDDGNTVSLTYSHDTATLKLYRFFFPDKINTIGNQNTGISFLGKQDKDLVRMELLLTDTISFNYEFDSKNRVTKQAISPGNYSTFEYTE